MRATDTAKPDLDALRANLDELGSKVDTAKVEVDDDAAKLKLLELNAELAALKKRTSMNIDSSGAARAEARIEKLRQGLDDLIHHTESAGGSRGILSRILFGAGGDAEKAEKDVGGLLGKLQSGFTGLGSKISDVLPLVGSSPQGFAGGLAALVGVGGAALVSVDALASGFAAAGAGAGAFALLAVPAFDKVKTAYSGIASAQAAYHKAQLTESMDPTKANAAAVAKSLLGLKEAWKGLDPAESGAVHGIQQFMGTLQKMSTAFEPAAFKVFNDGLKIANELLPHLAPFADIFASGLDKLLKQAGKFADSKGFREWLKQFKGLEGGSLHAIGEGLGHVVTNFGKLFTIMSKKDVVNGLNIAFSILDGTLIGLRGFIKVTMVAFDAFNGAMKWCGRVVDDLVHVIASGFDRARHDIASWADDVGRDTMDVVHFFEQLPGRILGALSSLAGQLFSWGEHIIDELADGIRSAAGGALSGAMNFVSGLISDFIPHSPAKRGPLSGSGDPRLGGKRIGQMLAEGLDDSRNLVSGAADRVAGGAVMGAHGGARGGAGAQPIQLEVRVPRAAMILGTDFWTAFQNGIRAKGGDPRIVQMKVVFQ